MIEIKIDGLEATVERLSLSNNDLVIVSGSDMTPSLIQAFRQQLLKALPLDTHILGVVAIYDDMRIETLHVRDGDTIVLHGAITDKQFEDFSASMKAARPGIAGVERLPPSI